MHKMAPDSAIEASCRLQSHSHSNRVFGCALKRIDPQQVKPAQPGDGLRTALSDNRKRISHSVESNRCERSRLRLKHKTVATKCGLCQKYGNNELVKVSFEEIAQSSVDSKTITSFRNLANTQQQQQKQQQKQQRQQCARLTDALGSTQADSIINDIQTSRVQASSKEMNSERVMSAGSEDYCSGRPRATSEKWHRIHCRESFQLGNLQNVTKSIKEAIMKTALFSRAALLISIYISITFTAIQATSTYQQQQAQQQSPSDLMMAPSPIHWPVSLPFAETQTGFNKAIAMNALAVGRRATGNALQDAAESTLHLWPAAWAAIVRHRQRQQTNRRRQRQQLAQQQQEQVQQQQQHDLQSAQQQQEKPPEWRRLMIGQHYSNFSSTVPYSVIQDNDYGPLQEDPTVDELPLLPIASNASSSLATSPFAKHSASDPYSALASLTDEQRLSLQHQQANVVAHQLQDASTSVASGSSMSRYVERSTGGSSRDTVQNKQNKNERALLPLDSTRLMLPQMQQIKSRFNQGCVGGTKCQFFAFCWMSGGSLGASCGLLMTCCVTPSRQEIQPGFYGPVVNDPCK